MIEIITIAGAYGRKSDVQLTVEGENVYNPGHPHTVNLYSDGTKELSAGVIVISRFPVPARHAIVRTGEQIKVDGVIYTIVGNRDRDPSLVEA
jgi:hypothetical protein